MASLNCFKWLSYIPLKLNNFPLIKHILSIFLNAERLIGWIIIKKLYFYLNDTICRALNYRYPKLYWHLICCDNLGLFAITLGSMTVVAVQC